MSLFIPSYPCIIFQTSPQMFAAWSPQMFLELLIYVAEGDPHNLIPDMTVVASSFARTPTYPISLPLSRSSFPLFTSQGALIGGIVGFATILWISMASFTVPRYPTLPPSSTTQCLVATNSSATANAIHST